MTKYSFKELNHLNRANLPMPIPHCPEVNLEVVPDQPRSGTTVMPVKNTIISVLTADIVDSKKSDNREQVIVNKTIQEPPTRQTDFLLLFLQFFGIKDYSLFTFSSKV